jgi:hypothetical protein
MKKIVPGALAALLSALALAAPAGAAPVNIGVRIEGSARTLVPRTVVRTTDAPVGKPGQPTCSGTSALGAVDRATAGDWAGPYDAGFQTYSLATLKGETHDAATSSYWAFWINYTYASMGVCGQQVQEGDDLLFVPECYATGCSPASPLRITGLPATVAPGAAVTVTVVQYSPPVYPATVTTSAPAAGATVSYGNAAATTGADGSARLSFSGAGPRTVQATKAGYVRSATESTCVTTGTDGACGSQLPSNNSPGGGGPATDTTAPVASFSRLHDGQVFERRRAPRKLTGTVSADPSGLLRVRLSILRKRAGRCTAFDGELERFRPHRCGGRRSFPIGDRANWSYLLPKRLGKGRYTLRIAAIDKAGNDSATAVRIRVR